MNFLECKTKEEFYKARNEWYEINYPELKDSGTLVHTLHIPLPDHLKDEYDLARDRAREMDLFFRYSAATAKPYDSDSDEYFKKLHKRSREVISLKLKELTERTGKPINKEKQWGMIWHNRHHEFNMWKYFGNEVFVILELVEITESKRPDNYYLVFKYDDILDENGESIVNT